MELSEEKKSEGKQAVYSFLIALIAEFLANQTGLWTMYAFAVIFFAAACWRLVETFGDENEETEPFSDEWMNGSAWVYRNVSRHSAGVQMGTLAATIEQRNRQRAGNDHSWLFAQAERQRADGTWFVKMQPLPAEIKQ